MTGTVEVLRKDLEDGSAVLGFFNRGTAVQNVSFNKFPNLGFRSKLHVRDLWRQRDLADLLDPGKDPLALIVPAHGVMLYKFTSFD